MFPDGGPRAGNTNGMLFHRSSFARDGPGQPSSDWWEAVAPESVREAELALGLWIRIVARGGIKDALFTGDPSPLIPSPAPKTEPVPATLELSILREGR